MTDRETVIYSIERCISHVPDACRDCSYDAGHPYNECVETLLKDALELLKEQPVLLDGHANNLFGRCPVCKAVLNPLRAKFCWKCGQAVKWA